MLANQKLGSLTASSPREPEHLVKRRGSVAKPSEPGPRTTDTEEETELMGRAGDTETYVTESPIVLKPPLAGCGGRTMERLLR